MAHLVAIAFFAGLLVALAVILEEIVKSHWTDIVAALKGAPVRREAKGRPAARSAAA